MGSTLSDNSNKQPIDVLEIRLNNIFINTDTIIINLLQYHFSPDIKDDCLKILESTKLDNQIIKIFHHKTIIYGICIPYLFDEIICVSEMISLGDNNKYYLM